MEKISEQLDEELAVAVPNDIDGPANIENWYTEEHVASALLYYADTKKNARDQDVLTRAQKFYACVVRNNQDYDLGGNRKRIKYGKSIIDLSRNLFSTMSRITDYLYLTPTGERRDEPPPDTGNDVLNQMLQVALRTERNTNDLRRESNERFDNVTREFNERFDNQELKLDQMSKQFTSISGKSRNTFQGSGGNLGTSSAYYPIVNDEGKFPEEEGLDPLTSLSQINSMNATVIHPYLRFYKLSTTGNIGEKQTRLSKFIGVSYEVTSTLGVKV